MLRAGYKTLPVELVQNTALPLIPRESGETVLKSSAGDFAFHLGNLPHAVLLGQGGLTLAVYQNHWGAGNNIDSGAQTEIYRAGYWYRGVGI